MGMQYGDTTMTKVFVGGLAWETQRDALREHFEKYGEILEAVIISDKTTGRSKGYGFVTFKEPDSAKKACVHPTPMINGRRANCNVASLGTRRTPKASPPATPTPVTVPPRQPAGQRGPPAQWYFAPPPGTLQQPPPPSPMHHYAGLVPYYPASAGYGYSPYNMTEWGYNAKLSPSSGVGSYVQGQYHTAQGGMLSPNALMPVYPMYPYHHHHHHHHSQNMGHFFPATTATSSAMTTVPTVVSKHATAMPPATVCMAVEQVTGCS